MFNPTPGPWEINGTEIVSSDNTVVIDCLGAMGGSGETKDDKALLAAAPEMYELLKYMLLYSNDAPKPAYMKIEALIAKIEGK